MTRTLAEPSLVIARSTVDFSLIVKPLSLYILPRRKAFHQHPCYPVCSFVADDDHWRFFPQCNEFAAVDNFRWTWMENTYAYCISTSVGFRSLTIRSLDAFFKSASLYSLSGIIDRRHSSYFVLVFLKTHQRMVLGRRGLYNVSYVFCIESFPCILSLLLHIFQQTHFSRSKLNCLQCKQH